MVPIFTDSYNISARRHLGDYLQPPYFTVGEIKAQTSGQGFALQSWACTVAPWTSASSSLKWGNTYDGVVWGAEDSVCKALRTVLEWVSTPQTLVIVILILLLSSASEAPADLCLSLV